MRLRGSLTGATLTATLLTAAGTVNVEAQAASAPDRPFALSLQTSRLGLGQSGGPAASTWLRSLRLTMRPTSADGAVALEIAYGARIGKVANTNLESMRATSLAVQVTPRSARSGIARGYLTFGATNFQLRTTPFDCPPQSIDCLRFETEFGDGTVRALTVGGGLSVRLADRLALRGDLRIHAPAWSSAPERANRAVRSELGFGASLHF